MEISQAWIQKSWSGEGGRLQKGTRILCSLTGLEQHPDVGVILWSPGVELAKFLVCSIL